MLPEWTALGGDLNVVTTGGNLCPCDIKLTDHSNFAVAAEVTAGDIT